MNYRSLLESWFYDLKNHYSAREIHSIFDWVAHAVHGWNRVDLSMHMPEEVTSKQRWNEILERLKNDEPIQYILEESEFCGLQLFVNSSTLIPRPETEELVDLIVNDFRGKTINALDIGTGSGCIILGIASQLKGKFYGTDISKETIEVARINSFKTNIKAEFLQDDILNSNLDFNNLDVIVSNPPYIPFMEIKDVGKNVLDYEPHQALFVENNNPILFYTTIADFAFRRLKLDGSLYFELNHNYAEEVSAYLIKTGWNASIIKDMQGKDRMLKACKV